MTKLLLAAPLFFLVGCPFGTKDSSPAFTTGISMTPDGHWRTGGPSVALDQATDLGYAAFDTTFPEFAGTTRYVNTVNFVPHLFDVDGRWAAGLFVDGETHITVSLYDGPEEASIPLIPHELLHACIGDPHHTQRQYWDKIFMLARDNPPLRPAHVGTD